MDKYNYKLALVSIICFPAFTSTTKVSDSFSPTTLSHNTNIAKIKTNVNDEIKIILIIKYKHQKGNIISGIDITDLFINPGENERLLFPFLFFRLNKIEK